MAPLDPRQMSLAFALEEGWISARAYRALTEFGMTRIGDFEFLTRKQLKGVRNFGTKCMFEVDEIMGRFGLSFEEG